MINLDINSVQPNPCHPSDEITILFEPQAISRYIAKGAQFTLVTSTIGNFEIPYTYFSPQNGLAQIQIPMDITSGVYDIEIVEEIRVPLTGETETCSIIFDHLEVQANRPDRMGVTSVRPNALIIATLKVSRRIMFNFSGSNLDQAEIVSIIPSPASGQVSIPLQIISKSSEALNCQATLNDRVLNNIRPGQMKFMLMSEDNKRIYPSIGVTVRD